MDYNNKVRVYRLLRRVLYLRYLNHLYHLILYNLFICTVLTSNRYRLGIERGSRFYKVIPIVRIRDVRLPYNC